MNVYDVLQILVYLLSLILLASLLGRYMTAVFQGDKFSGKQLFSWLENLVYKSCKINPENQMTWKTYMFSLLIFNLLGLTVVFLLQIFQKYLPMNLQHLENVNPALAFNTSVSFSTNTNWQSYAGETTLSYFVQMVGLTVQNFVSAATGIAVMLALIRGFKNRISKDLGNFWVDLTRSVMYVLLPLSIILSLILVSQGVVQTFNSYAEVSTLEGNKQMIPLGPAASQIAIKQLGTNGGGFFNSNSSFPFENPTPFSNFLEMLAILLIPAALTITFGRMIGFIKQGWSLFYAMFFMFCFALAVMMIFEYSYNPVFQTSGIYEGKEVRFGITNSVLWANATTAASNGSVNAMHSSLSPITGMFAMLNIMLGEVIFGGVGAGMYGMLIFVILTVFIAGLMVGRTPEYLGKKIESFEVKMATLGVLAPNFVILVFSAIAVMATVGLSSIANPGPHGFSEILYAFTSAAGNNGSAFAGLNANTGFYNIMLGLGMLIGRFAIIIPVLAIAGSLSEKKYVPQSNGTFRTDTTMFVFLLIAVILIVGALTHFPALSLGPIVEHFLMQNSVTF